MVGITVGDCDVFIDVAGAIDVDAEKARLQKEIDNVAPYVAAQEKKLGNKGFVDNAPAEVVEGEKQKLAEAKEKLEKLQNQLDSL